MNKVIPVHTIFSLVETAFLFFGFSTSGTKPQRGLNNPIKETDIINKYKLHVILIDI